MKTMMVCDWDLQFNKYNIYINIYIISWWGLLEHWIAQAQEKKARIDYL